MQRIVKQASIFTLLALHHHHHHYHHQAYAVYELTRFLFNSSFCFRVCSKVFSFTSCILSLPRDSISSFSSRSLRLYLSSSNCRHTSNHTYRTTTTTTTVTNCCSSRHNKNWRNHTELIQRSGKHTHAHRGFKQTQRNRAAAQHTNFSSCSWSSLITCLRNFSCGNACVSEFACVHR